MRTTTAFICTLLSCALSHASAPPRRVATLYCSWNKGGYSFRNEWDGILRQMRLPFDRYENTKITELAAKLDQYDVVIACSVFNLEHTQDLGTLRQPFLDFLSRGGMVLVTDASYGSTLGKGLCAWSPDFTLSTATASSHRRPSPETRRLTFGPDPALAQAPNELLAMAESVRHWAHMVPKSDAWRRALLDSDGQPTLVWQRVGKGLLVATSYYALNRGNRQQFGKALLENALFMAESLRAGVEVLSLDMGPLGPGQNAARIQVRNATDQPLRQQLTFTLCRGDEKLDRQEMTATAEPGQLAACEWQYQLHQRGVHRIELTLKVDDAKPPLVLRRERTVPEVLTLFAWKRHFYVHEESAAVRANLVPDQPFVAAEHRLEAQAALGDQQGQAVVAPAAAQELRVPLDGLGSGKGYIDVKLMRGQAEVARAALPLTIAADPYVRIMPDRSCQVAGKPFFPIGMYVVSWRLPDTEAILQKLRGIAAGGFNLVHVGVRSEAEFAAVLAEAQRLSLMIIPEGGASHRGVSQFRGHPSVLAWNPGDEPDGRGTPAEKVASRVAQIKDDDPSRPAYMTLCVPAKYDRYHRAADILAPDPYPIPRRPIGFVAECIEKLQRVIEYRKPIWAIPQSFGGYSSWSRPPTPLELRNMTYQCLVHGVRGLVYYTYWDGGFAMADHPALWAMMQRVAREVKQLTPVLLSPSDERYLKAGPQGQVHVMLKSHGGRRYLLAVNTTRSDLGNVAVPLPEGWEGAWQGVFEGPRLESPTAALTLSMPALAISVYHRSD